MLIPCLAIFYLNIMIIRILNKAKDNAFKKSFKRSQNSYIIKNPSGSSYHLITMSDANTPRKSMMSIVSLHCLSNSISDISHLKNITSLTEESSFTAARQKNLSVKNTNYNHKTYSLSIYGTLRSNSNILSDIRSFRSSVDLDSYQSVTTKPRAQRVSSCIHVGHRNPLQRPSERILIKKEFKLLRKLRQTSRTTFILILISFSFLLLNLPYLISWTFYYLHEKYQVFNSSPLHDKLFFNMLVTCTEIFHVFNYCINFLLYCISSKIFRQDLKSMILFRMFN